jgi:hypothetical protein
MNKWEIKFGDMTFYLYGMHINEIVTLIKIQNWNMDIAYCTSIKLVDEIKA